MDILGYIGYAILIFEAITGTMYVRRRSAGFPVIIMAAFFVISSIILWALGINKLHAWWLIPAGFVLKYLIAKVPAPVYSVPFKDLKGILSEWAKVSFFSPIVILAASLFACIVRVGISPEKIRIAQQIDATNVVDRLFGSKNKQLIEAVKSNDLQAVKSLLDDCAEVNAIDNEGRKALGWAAYKGHTEIAKLLLEKGAEVNAKTEKGTTTLMLAAEKNNMEISKLLLANNADVNAKASDNGETALMTAVQNGHLAIIRLLLENGAEINVKNNKGATALLVAAYAGHTEVVKALLEKGADVDASTDNGITALLVARKNGHADIAQLLEKAGAEE